MTTSEAPPRARARRRPFRETLEAAVSAIVVALLLKAFAVEAYRIPSGSMQPTLFGWTAPDGREVKDRLLVDRIAYTLGDPARFDVAVFRFPLDRSRAFVKRVIGLPGETIRIRHGDVQLLGPDGAWSALRRPRRVMDAMWLELELAGRLELAGVRAEGERLRFDAGGELRFPAPSRVEGAPAGVLDDPRDGYPEPMRDLLRAGAGSTPVGDLRVELAVEVPESGDAWLEITLTERGEPDAVEHVARLSTGAHLAPGAVHRVAFEHLDDRVRLELDGATLRDEPVAPVEPSGARVRVAASGGTVLRDLRVLRDVHYLPGRAATDEWTVPAGHYFVLGDNARRSVDSREWRLTGYRFESGPRAGEVVRAQMTPGENPAAAFDDEGGPTWYLRDELGERHRMSVGDVLVLPPVEAPFVPRDHMYGRAILAFWPRFGRLGIERPSWVR